MTHKQLLYSLRKKEKSRRRLELELERTRRALQALAELNFSAQQNPAKIRTVKLKLRKLKHEIVIPSAG